MRRPGRIGGIIAIVCVAAVAVPAALGATSAVRPTTASNRAAARRDAVRLLGLLRLPADATASATEPRGAGYALQAPPASGAAGGSADAHAWWIVPRNPAAVLAWVRAHAPRGARMSGTGSGDDSRTGYRYEILGYAWPPIAGVLAGRQLTITVTALSGGETALLADAAATWIVTRSPLERIPTATRAITITSTPFGAPATTTTVTDAGRVDRIVALFNAMPIVQPIPVFCPVELLQGSVKLTFAFQAAPGGASLARATFTQYLHFSASGPCNAVDLTIGGRVETPLLGGDVVTKVQRILGTTLTSRG